MTDAEALVWCQCHRADVRCFPGFFRVEVYTTTDSYGVFMGATLWKAVERAMRCVGV
jgi:hypothetical protein